MRVVLDTKVLIASFIARGICTDVFERVISEHELFISHQILEEFEHVMTRKLGMSPERTTRAAALLRRSAEIVDPEPLASAISRDRDDDQVLALAVSSGAACVVTGDDDLLVLHPFKNIQILTPRQFLTFKPE